MLNLKPYRDRSITSFSENTLLARLQLIFRILVMILVMPVILFWRALAESVWPNVLAVSSELGELGYIWRELGKPKYKKEI